MQELLFIMMVFVIVKERKVSVIYLGDESNTVNCTYVQCIAIAVDKDIIKNE